jgi:DNA mismatch repair ATPase MutL
MSDFQTGDSRMATRSQKRKQNRLLNLLIAIVVILILIVAYSMFSGGSNSADHSAQTSANGSNHSGGDGGSGVASGSNSNHDKIDKNKAESDQNGGTTDDQQQSAQDDQKQPDNEKKDEQKNEDKKSSGGGPDGPWKPIGTKQKGSHVSSYEKGSIDWNEKIQALKYATGIHGDYILWRLENGGGPQQSIGKVSPKDNPHEMYVVHLKWVKNKGWKPTSVEKVSR